MDIKHLKVILYSFIFQFYSSTAEFVSYEGYKVFEIYPKTTEDVEFLFNLSRNSKYYGLDFWKLDKYIDSYARVMVPPSGLEDFVDSLEMNNIEFEEFIDDVEKTIEEERTQLALYDDGEYGISFKKYYRYDEINDYLDNLAKKYPKRVEVATVGQSYEGRNMNILRVKSKNNATSPVTIFVDAAIHAREWIAPSTALYAITQLVEGSEKPRKYDEVLNDIEWIFLPVVNPDGYEYSHKKDRFWRKTRRKAGMCVGVDGNRNFDHEWGTQGASRSSCAQTYRGDEVFSEPETRVVRDIMSNLQGHCKMYLTLHSYGKYLLYPYGHTSKLPENWQEVDDVARAGAEAIREYSGSKYRIGSTRNVLYAASGSSTDYAYSTHKIPISLTMELPGGGRGGFDPPPSSIESSVKESWEGIRAMAIRIAEKFSTQIHFDYDEYHDSWKK